MTRKEKKAPEKQVFEVLITKTYTLEKTIHVLAESEEAIEEAAANGELDEFIDEHDFDYANDSWQSATAESVSELAVPESKRRIKNNDYDHEVESSDNGEDL